MQRRAALAALAAPPLLTLAPAAWPSDPSPQPQLQQLVVAGSRIELQFDEDLPAPLHAAAAAWVGRSAQAVALWLGRFPVPDLELLLQAADGVGVMGGTTFAEPALYVRIRLGRDTQAAQLADPGADDGVLVHELLHLAVPRVGPMHQWLHEGIATYAEGAVRVRAGLLSAPHWWGGLVRGLPNGQPAAGDAGLDHTPTWGRTYWGGALFCLQADIEMRRRHSGRGLREALQGLLAAGGSHAVAWPMAQVLAVADAAVGGTVLATLYQRHRAQAVAVDLPALWQALGVDTRTPLLPRLDDGAPLAAVRRAIAG